MILKTEKILPVTLDSKPLFDEYAYGADGISFYTFSTLYMWQPDVGYKFAVTNGMITVAGCDSEAGDFCYMPVAKAGAYDPQGLKEALSEAIKLFGTDRFYPLDGKMLGLIRQSGADTVDVKERRDLCDYVYPGDRMRTLQGKAYHAKRNHINKFFSEYDFSYLEINEGNIAELSRAAETLSEGGDGNHISEYFAINRLIGAFSLLGEKAGVIYADGEPVGYSIGEDFGTDTALIQVEKASKTVDGAYTVINNEFLKRSFPNAVLINREEDMGLEHLRKAKMSYSPLPFNMIYEARIAL
ncbi:MAG: DUF2156 domain-containing protein [Clostridia bacterium]|nr:DUF2156 domain-containing protein [Clostridia bacterium]